MPHKHIHRILKSHSPAGVHKARRLVAFKYPKLLFLVVIISLSYYLFTLPAIKIFVANLGRFSYLSDFIAGLLFSFGFTTPLSIGYIITSNSQNLIITSLIAGAGSLIGDMVIFKTIKFSFMDEFKELEKRRAIQKIEKIVEKNKHVLIRHYLIYIFAGIILASPLPDEIGVSLLAGLTTVKPKIFAIISFLLHSIGFYIIAYIAM